MDLYVLYLREKARIALRQSIPPRSSSKENRGSKDSQKTGALRGEKSGSIEVRVCMREGMYAQGMRGSPWLTNAHELGSLAARGFRT